jgi:hypothetical protein
VPLFLVYLQPAKMKSKLRKHCLALAMVVAHVLALTGCGGVPESASSLATCIAEGMSEQETYELGQALERSPDAPKLRRLAAGTCGGALSFWTDEAFRESVSLEVASKLQSAPAFARGRYASLLPVNTTAAQRARLGELGLMLQEVGIRRAAALACHAVEESAVTMVSQLDTTLALAAVGRYVGVPDLEAAKAVSAAVVDRAQKLTRAAVVPSCGDGLTRQFRADVTAWQMFYEGQHPWMPGCSVRSESDAFVLKCAG